MISNLYTPYQFSIPRLARTKRHKKCAFCTKKLVDEDFDKLEKKVKERLTISENWRKTELDDSEKLQKRKQL